MGKTVWGRRDLKWDGFEPRAYVLDATKVWKLPLRNTSSDQELTIGDVVEAFRGQKVELDDRVLDLAIQSESKELVVRGPSFHRDLLKHLYWFSDRDVSPHSVFWFYYASDSCREDPQNAYFFFLVTGNKILDERVMLSDSIDNGFDPTVLIPASDPNPTWLNDPEWDHANDKLFYRKFYTETHSGELMVLRPDGPELYHYPEGRSTTGGGTQAWLSEIRGVLATIKFAIWVLVALAMLQVYLQWK